VLYEQNLKRNGLPTTEEAKQAKLMETIMDSPAAKHFASPTYDPKIYGSKQGSNNGPSVPFTH